MIIKPGDYWVILEGWSDNPIHIQRRNDFLYSDANEIFHHREYEFPIRGLVIGLNSYGEPLVIPQKPARLIILHFFKWKLE